MFRSIREVRYIQDSDLGAMLLGGLSDEKTVALAYWNAGMKHVFYKKPITSLSDLDGLVLRSTGSNSAQGTLTRFGIDSSLRLEPSEVLPALFQGDAAELTPATVVRSIHQAPPTYVLATPLRPDARVMIANRALWQKLSYQDQVRLSRLFRDAAAEADKLANEIQSSSIRTLVDDAGFALSSFSGTASADFWAVAQDVWSSDEDLAGVGIVVSVIIQLDDLRRTSRLSPINLPAITCCKEVIFATNRALVAGVPPWCQFSAVRGAVIVGTVTIESSDVANDQCDRGPDAAQPVVYGGLEALPALLGADRDVLLYVHGYRSSFEDAIFDALQFARAINFPGAIVSFSWASQDSVYDYCNDFQAAVISADDFSQILTEFPESSNLNVIAHSMGTVVVARSFQGAAFQSLPMRFSNVVAIAGDEERDIFEGAVGMLGMPPGRISVYASSLDGVLGLARAFTGCEIPPHSGPRIGQAGDDLVDHSSVDAIDATLASKESSSGHSYHWASPTLHADLIELLKDVDASTRSHIEPQDPRPPVRVSNYYWLRLVTHR